MPESAADVVFETFASYFLWLLATLIVLFTMFEVVASSRVFLFASKTYTDRLNEEALAKLPVVNAQETFICGICLENVLEGTEVKQIPECLHQFHIGCIDGWLKVNAICPYCRRDVAAIEEPPIDN